MMPIARFVLFCLILFAGRPVAAAVPSDLIQSVIQRQMKAFNENDYPTAYTFASESIRRRFSKERFETMVRSGYPQIAKSHLVSFGEIALSGDQQAALATVHVTGKDRVTVVAQYQMVLEGKEWKIGGVAILEEFQPIGTPIKILSSAKEEGKTAGDEGRFLILQAGFSPPLHPVDRDSEGRGISGECLESRPEEALSLKGVSQISIEKEDRSDDEGGC
jgi:hypothetical protein